MPDDLNPNGEKAAHTPDEGRVTPSQANPGLGYEATDVNVRGVLVFLTSLGAFILVFFVFCFGMGKVINTALVKHDGPANKWNQFAAAPHKMGKSMQSVEVMEQQQLQLMTQRFPTPRLQMDDGNQDLADMHQREDLLLDHYTWVDKQSGTVRVPIDRAMEIIVAKGLPVAPSAVQTQDVASRITAPLTNGFARTTYEQDLAIQDNVMGQRKENDTARNNTQPKARPETAKLDAKPQAGGIQ